MKYNYKPRPQDVEWARQLLRASNHNAVWSIPRSMIIFRIDHEQKALIQTDGPTKGKLVEDEYDANGAVFGALGYKVVPLGMKVEDVPLPDDERHWESFRRRDMGRS